MEIRIVNLYPDIQSVLKWGPLSYLSEADRNEVMAMSKRDRDAHIARIGGEVAKIRVRERRTDW